MSSDEQLVEAARLGDLEKMKSALQQGADVNVRIRSGCGGTALYQAASNNQVAAIELLLEVDDLDVNNTDTNASRWSALLAAAIAGHSECVRALLTHPDIDVNLENRQGKTPLIYAVLGNKMSVVDLLLENENIDVNKKDESGFDALMYSAKENKPKIAELLLKRPDQELSENNGHTAEGIARDRRYKKLADLIHDYTAKELRTEVGLKLKENGLVQYAEIIYGNKVHTLEQARTLTENDLVFMQVAEEGERKKILKLFGGIDENDQISVARVVQTQEEVLAKAATQQARREQVRNDETLATVVGLPQAPTGQVQARTQQEEDSIPYAKPVLE